MSQDIEISKAKKIIEDNRVSKLIHDEYPFDNFYLVTGKSSDYLVVYPDFCSCIHFIVTCIKTRGKICKHILAVQICKETKIELREIEVENIKEFVQTIFID